MSTSPKFVLEFVSVFMDRVETQFIKGVSLKTWICLRYIDDTFFALTYDEEILKKMSCFIELIPS